MKEQQLAKVLIFKRPNQEESLARILFNRDQENHYLPPQELTDAIFEKIEELEKEDKH